MARTFGEMGIREIQTGLAAKEFSAAEVARGTFERIGEADGAVHAFLETTEELALDAAARIDAAVAEGRLAEMGPLAGVPVGYKDNLNLTGTHTTCSSNMLRDYVSPYTATCVEKTLRAGAHSHRQAEHGRVRLRRLHRDLRLRPHLQPVGCRARARRQLGRKRRGRGGGLCAGVARVGYGRLHPPTGLVLRSGGREAHLRRGVALRCGGLRQLARPGGPFARSVEDAALALNALSGRDELDCTSQPCDVDFTANLAEGARGMKIGIVPAFMEAAGLAPEVRAKVEEAAAVLQDMGAELVEVELPHAQAAMSAYYVLGPCEAFSNLARFDSVRYGYCDPGHKDLASQYEASRAKGFGPEARRRIMLGSYLLSAGVYDKYYYPAQQVRTLITRDYAAAFEKVDVILSPVAPTTAFKIGEICDPTEMYLADMFTISINIAGNGGLSFPVGLGADTGLPVGVQIIAPPFKDKNMFRAAAALEQHYGPAPVAPDFADGKVGA